MSFAGHPPPGHQPPHGSQPSPGLQPQPGPWPPAGGAGPHPTHSPSGWFDRTRVRTKGLGCGVTVIAALLVAAVVAAYNATVGGDIHVGLAATAVGLLVVAVAFTAYVGHGAPRLITHQGIAVDTGGVTLLQEPKWWFRGRRLHLSWPEVVSVTAETFILSEERRDGSVPKPRTIMISLRHEPPRTQLPGFAQLFPAHAPGPVQGPPREVPRLAIHTTNNDHHEFLALVTAIRPDLLVEPDAAPHPAPPARPTPPAMSAPAPGGPQPPPAPGTPTGTGGWISMRGSQIVGWFVAVAITVGLGWVASPEPVLRDAAALLAGEPGDATTGQLVYALVWAVAILAVLVALLVRMPASWTVQGIDVTPYGITMLRRPMWWFGGRTGSIPWTDVHHVTWATGRRGDRVLEIHLRWVDHNIWLPHWAKLVLAGEAKWGRTTEHPRVIITLTHTGRKLEGMIADLRPDLLEAFDPTAHAGPTGAMPAGAMPGGTGPVPPPGHVRPRWVNLRRRRATQWVLGLLAVIYLDVSGVFWLAFGLTEVVEAGTFIAEDFGILVSPVTAVAMTTLLVYMAPRMLTHQGVSADDSGITLVQEPALWFAGRTIHLPWPEIRLVRPDIIVRATRKRRRTERVVDIYLHQPDRIASVPTWARVVAREDATPPASVTQPMTRITVRPGDRAQPGLVEALRAVRPDLVAGGG